MNFENVKYDIHGQTAIITINRPQVYNALNVQGKLDIISAIKEANNNTNIRSIILTGEGKAFCSGQDLNDRTVSPDHGPVDLGVTLATEWNPLVNSIVSSEKLIIGAINGVCAGAGLSVALACDLKIALKGTRFISGFTQIGLCPDAGLSNMLVNILGYTKSLEFALLGKPFMSEEMLSMGFINQVSENPLQDAQTLAESINRLAPLSVKAVKKNFKFAQENSWSASLENERLAQQSLGFSQDYKEGVKAFLEKRKPEFKGI